MPNIIRLPADVSMLSAQHLRASLGASRAVLSLWRRKYGFPLAYRDGGTTFTFRDDVVRWCRAHGGNVRMIL